MKRVLHRGRPFLGGSFNYRRFLGIGEGVGKGLVGSKNGGWEVGRIVWG